MGAIFKPPRAPAPPPPPPPPPPAPVIKAPTPAIQPGAATAPGAAEQTRTITAAKAKKGQRASVMTRTPARGGSSGAVRTGGLGLLDPAPVSKKTLLGQ